MSQLCQICKDYMEHISEITNKKLGETNVIEAIVESTKDSNSKIVESMVSSIT